MADCPITNIAYPKCILSSWIYTYINNIYDICIYICGLRKKMPMTSLGTRKWLARYGIIVNESAVQYDNVDPDIIYFLDILTRNGISTYLSSFPGKKMSFDQNDFRWLSDNSIKILTDTYDTVLFESDDLTKLNTLILHMYFDISSNSKKITHCSDYTSLVQIFSPDQQLMLNNMSDQITTFNNSLITVYLSKGEFPDQYCTLILQNYQEFIQKYYTSTTCWLELVDPDFIDKLSIHDLFDHVIPPNTGVKSSRKKN